MRVKHRETTQRQIETCTLKTQFDNTLTFFIISNLSSSNFIRVTSQEAFPDLDWTHLVFTYNGSINASGMKIYKDGSSVALNIIQDNLTDTTITSGHFNIGTFNNGSGVFKGAIDEVLIFNRTLAALEVSALFNASASYRNNFTGLNIGETHTFTGYAVDIAGNRNETPLQSVTVTNAPILTAKYCFCNSSIISKSIISCKCAGASSFKRHVQHLLRSTIRKPDCYVLEWVVIRVSTCYM